MRIILSLLAFCVLFVACGGQQDNQPRRAEVLFLAGETGHDQANKYATWLAIELFKSGINLTYTTDFDDLNDDYLDYFDGVIVYTDSATLSGSQESALRGFVSKGKGLVPIHFGSAAFSSSEWYGSTVGGRISNHAEQTVSLQLADTAFGITQGVSPFEVGNETYSHENVDGNNTVVLVATNGDPYAWVREAGKGRVFYTALGKEESTWKNRNFLRLLRNGVRWTLGERVGQLVADLNIPDVSIYGDTISDFTARYDVPAMQDPLPPEEAMKLLQVPVGFELKLFASEPDIVNPMAMSWDEQGRLWVIESEDYPNSFQELGKDANDRIKIAEDTDGDGVADKFTVFADSLNIATSLTFVNDGVLVAMAPHFLFLKDTDGDGVADVRDTVMTGWRKNDTHAGPSNLQYGFDNKIWGVTGYAGFDGQVNGERHVFGQGVYRFNPDGSDFEFLATTSNNTWGLGMSEDNNVFISTANNTHSAFYSMPERLIQRRLMEAEGSQNVNAVQKIDGHYDVHALTPNLRQVDVVGGFTSAAGHQMYTARDYPESYWNKVAFVTEPTVRLVHNAIIEPDGAGFKERDGWNLTASSDEWYGPIHAEVGPDGAVWILDWYNFIIQHNVFVPAQAPSEKVLPFVEQPHGPGNAFESNLRDKKHGRVYRVLHKDAKHRVGHKLSKNDVSGLLKALQSDNKLWRMHAQRLLVERQDVDVANDLVKIASDRKVDKIGLNAPAIHALWTLHGLGLIESDQNVFDAVVNSLSHPSGAVRKAALQVLPADERSLEALLQSQVMQDEHLNTRLAAFLKVIDFPASREVANALHDAVADGTNETDRWLSQALYAAVIQHEVPFLEVSASRTLGSFANRILGSLADERYTLGRRSRLLFSPNVANKEIHIDTEIGRRDNQPYHGLIVGQGNSQDGYALYAKNDRLFFEVYQHGHTTTVSSRGRLPNRAPVNAQVLSDGSVRLSIGGAVQGEAKVNHLFPAPLGLYLRSGNDFGGSDALADYEGSSDFTGHMNNVTVRLSPGLGAQATAASPEAGETSASTEPATRIEIKAVKDIMQYDVKLVTVRAGERITLVFDNPDVMQHNLLIIQKGTLDVVGKAADDMLRAADAFDKQYIPDIPEVLHSTPLVDPGESFTLEFTAPTEAGDYPYVCTFPGHWRGMNGILRVVN